MNSVGPTGVLVMPPTTTAPIHMSRGRNNLTPRAPAGTTGQWTGATVERGAPVCSEALTV